MPATDQFGGVLVEETPNKTDQFGGVLVDEQPADQPVNGKAKVTRPSGPAPAEPTTPTEPFRERFQRPEFMVPGGPGSTPPAFMLTGREMKEMSETPIIGPEGLPKVPTEATAGLPASMKANIGLYNAAAGLVDFFLTPQGLATLGIGGASKAAQTAVSGYWAVRMAMQVPELAKQTVAAFRAGDIAKATEGTANLLVAAGAPLGLGAAAVGRMRGARGVEAPVAVPPTPPTEIQTTIESAKPVLPTAASEAEKVTPAPKPTEPTVTPVTETVTPQPTPKTYETAKETEPARETGIPQAPAEVPNQGSQAIPEEVTFPLQPGKTTAWADAHGRDVELVGNKYVFKTTEAAPARAPTSEEAAATPTATPPEVGPGIEVRTEGAEGGAISPEPVKAVEPSTQPPAPEAPTVARTGETGKPPEGGGPPVGEPTAAQVAPVEAPVKKGLQVEVGIIPSKPLKPEKRRVSKITGEVELPRDLSGGVRVTWVGRSGKTYHGVTIGKPEPTVIGGEKTFIVTVEEVGGERLVDEAGNIDPYARNIHQLDIRQLSRDEKNVTPAEIGPERQIQTTPPPSAKSAPVETAKAREPWEMTGEEWLRSAKRGKLHKATGKLTAAEQSYEEHPVKTPLGYGEAAGYSPDDIARFYAERSGALDRKRFAHDSEWFDAVESARREYISDALAEGKPVPASVLAEYPDLSAAAKAKTSDGAGKESVGDAIARIDEELKGKWITPAIKGELERRRAAILSAQSKGDPYAAYETSKIGSNRWGIVDSKTGQRVEVPKEVEHPELGKVKTTVINFRTKGEATKAIEGLAKPPTAPPAEGKGKGGEVVGATGGPQLAPVTQPTVSALPPKSQRQIITDLARGLSVPIRFGRLRTTKWAGYFLKTPNLIGAKLANDIPIVAHEVGHKMDVTFRMSSMPGIEPELLNLGDPNLPGSRSSWTSRKPVSLRKEEGMAEFVRHWLTEPSEAQRLAPNTYRTFESALDNNRDVGAVLRQAREDIRLWREAEPQARLRSHISVGANPNNTRYTMADAVRDLVDDLHYTRLTVDDYKKFGGAAPSPSQNIYLLARNLRGSFGMADTFIRNGVADFSTKSVTLGTSLQDALKGVGGRLNDFRDWIVAKQAQELRRQGKETGLVESDVDYVANKFDRDASFQDAFTKVKAWNDALLKYAVDSGLVSQEAATAMKQMNSDYVPFHRVFEAGAGEPSSVGGGGPGRGLNLGKPASLRTRTGSLRDIVDPIETMIRNAYTIITASEKSAMHHALADYATKPGMGKWIEHIASPKSLIQVGVEKIRKQLQDAGADLSAIPDDLLLQFYQQSGKAPYGENIIRVVVNGEPEFYRLNPNLYDTFHALDNEDTGKIVRMVASQANLLRAGVTLAPDFALANAMRDTFSSAIISKYGALPFVVTAKGFGAMLKEPKLVAEWQAAGGKNAIEATYFDREKLQRFMREHIAKDLKPSERALIFARKPLMALRLLTELSEEATRIGEYKTAYEKLITSGMPEGDARRLAAFESRDRQDFAKGGAKTKILRHWAAFWNAGLQANVRLYQAFKQAPLATTLKGLAFITIPKMLEQAVNYNDPDYWDRPQWERDLFFLIPFRKDDTGHTQFIRLPTPFEPGIIFGTLPGRMVQVFRERNSTALAGLLNSAAQNSVPNPLPQAASVLFADFLSGPKGWDVFRWRQIVPESLSRLPPDMQWTEQTSLTAKKIGALFGFPPVKVDHIIQGSTGGLGRQLTHQVVDRLLSYATGEKPAEIRTVPGGRFVTTPATASSQSIEQFYDVLNTMRTEKERVKHGGGPARVDTAMLSEFEDMSQRMSDARKSAREAKTPEQKRYHQERLLNMARSIMSRYNQRIIQNP